MYTIKSRVTDILTQAQIQTNPRTLNPKTLGKPAPHLRSGAAGCALIQTLVDMSFHLVWAATTANFAYCFYGLDFKVLGC